MAARVHPTSVVSDTAQIGDGTQIWLFCQVRENARIGQGCIFGKGVYVDYDVVIGDRCKIQNNVSIFAGVTIEDGVFLGPHACFTNDKLPRAVTPEMALKGLDDWVITKTLVKAGAAVGANATVVCGVTIGRWAMVAAGSVVTKDVPDHALVAGTPARRIGWVCACGQRVALDDGELRPGDPEVRAACACGRTLVRGHDAVRMA